MADAKILLKDRVALITGASRGIGAEAAKCFAAAGAHVILVARTVGGLEAVDDAIRKAGGSATLVPLDLRQHDLIDQLGASIYQRWGKLDILLGNAAMLGQLTPLNHVEPNLWKEVMDVNLTANYRLIRSMDPLLRQSDAGRVIFVTSGAARRNFAYWGPYGISKAGLEAMVKTYAEEVADTQIKVNLFDPGIVRTAMRAQAFPGENPQSLSDPERVARQLLGLATPACKHHGEITHAA
jgi:NAD(P)-dependent dehydrogenase (short-subunit alcohol dehydrogenase family)